ncbi:MAG: hypothetical protein WKF71_13740 [Pyrinomonadaceae bacterium]
MSHRPVPLDTSLKAFEARRTAISVFARRRRIETVSANDSGYNRLRPCR